MQLYIVRDVCLDVGRVSMPLGMFVQRRSEAWPARTLYRDLDGRTLPVARNEQLASRRGSSSPSLAWTRSEM